jgi:glutamate N-acetyltransferase/amino-acid N-acetyltransferase
MKEISGGVCAPKGFRAGGIWCGIKASSRKRDLALIYSEKPCTAAAMFTRNRVKSACVLVSQKHLERGICRAVIVNSGNANACTGEDGLRAAKKMAELAADLFAIRTDEVAVASTGVIGVPLPVAAIESGIESLASSLRSDESGHEAALEAIMTTDTRKKGGAFEIEIEGKALRLGAMVKGSGMIHPNLATMLGFITTDAAISREMLDAALRRAVSRSFNSLSIDGDTSTNDTILVMASGLSGISPIETKGGAFETFAAALEALCIKLSRDMARDGEGATRLLTVTVTGAQDEDSARSLAKAVVSSNLVKAACFGADANWGRVLCAMGYSGVDFDPDHVDVSFAGKAGVIPVCKEGAACPFSEEDAKKILLEDEIEILIKAGAGSGEAAAWGCDLSYDYVKINGDYRS